VAEYKPCLRIAPITGAMLILLDFTITVKRAAVNEFSFAFTGATG